MTPPTLADWTRMPWHARKGWARRHALTDAAAALAVVIGAYPPPPRRPWARMPEWSDADHRASLAGDHDPAVVLARRAAATGLPLEHPSLMTPDLPRSPRA